MTTKIDTISLALMLRPNPTSHAGFWRTPSGWSVSGMNRHRNFRANAMRFTNRRQVHLLRRENGQITGDESEDGEAERDEHGRNHDFGPLWGVACADRVFYAGDGDIET